MKEEVINKIKEDYLEKVKQNNKNKKSLEVLIKRKELLENNILVLQYIELANKIKDYRKQVSNENSILDLVLENYKDDLINDEDSLFIYLGSFCFDDYDNELQVSRNDNNFIPEYNLYGNIETAQFVVIDYMAHERFEKTNKVLVTNNFPDINDFYELRNEFFKDLIYDGQKEATAKVLKRNLKK